MIKRIILTPPHALLLWYWHTDQYLPHLKAGQLLDDQQSPFRYRNFNLIVQKTVTDAFLHFIANFQEVFTVTPDGE